MATEQNKRTLFIRGLADEVDKEVLYSAFSPFGNILNLEIPKNRDNGTNRGIAFIEFEEEEEARHAIYNRHESELYGRVIKVAFSTHSHTRPTTHRFKAVWADDPNFGHDVSQDSNTDNK